MLSVLLQVQPLLSLFLIHPERTHILSDVQGISFLHEHKYTETLAAPTSICRGVIRGTCPLTPLAIARPCTRLSSVLVCHQWYTVTSGSLVLSLTHTPHTV